MGRTAARAVGRTAGEGSAIGWAFRAFAALTVALVLVQAALAGRGLYGDPGVISLHGWLGNVTFAAAIAQVAVGFGGLRRGAVGRSEAGLSLLLLALIVAQLGLGYVGRERAGAAAWHIPNGVLTFGVAAAILALAGTPAGRRETDPTA